MYKSAWNKLTTCDIRHIRLPRYKKKDFRHIKNILTYKAFRNNMLTINKFPLSRREMDACWMKLLFKHFKKWNPDDKEIMEEGTNHPEWMHSKLGEAINQRLGGKNDNVQSWWEDQAKKHPGLDIEEVPVDADSDHPGMFYWPDYESDSDDGAAWHDERPAEDDQEMGGMEGDEHQGEGTWGEDEPMDAMEEDAIDEGAADSAVEHSAGQPMFGGPLVIR